MVAEAIVRVGFLHLHTAFLLGAVNAWIDSVIGCMEDPPPSKLEPQRLFFFKYHPLMGHWVTRPFYHYNPILHEEFYLDELNRAESPSVWDYQRKDSELDNYFGWDKVAINNMWDSYNPVIDAAFISRRYTAAAAVVSINFIDAFESKVKTLLKSIPTAKKDHIFSASAGDLDALTAEILDEDLWSTFDKPLTEIIPVSDHNTCKHLIVRGRYRLPAFVALVQHLVYTCKMDHPVLKPKLEWLMETIDRTVAVAGKAPKRPPAKKLKKQKNEDAPGDTQAAKKSKAIAHCTFPTIAVPSTWLFAANWKLLPGNEDLPEPAFQTAWVTLEKEDKVKLKIGFYDEGLSSHLTGSRFEVDSEVQG
ncbi:hypothetical protein PQX77_021255 [Marasmius sp. AFHP31]|nr:hypothetical protein PQX77_021255 [Marasmius sp. AFHP31]